MALINRAARLLRADLHAVLDRVEEPDILLRQAVREMQSDIDRDEQRLQQLVHEQGQLLERLRDLDASLAESEPQLDTCLAAGNDDLARVLLRRRLEARRMRELIAKRRESREQALSDLRRRLDEHRSRLAAMQQKLELVAADDAPGRREPPWPAPELSVSDDDVEVALLQEKQRRHNG